MLVSYQWTKVSGPNQYNIVSPSGTMGEVTAVSIATAGTGYVVSDELIISGGTGAGLVLTVTTIGGGGDITGVSITTAGVGYESTDVGLTETGGSGTLATFDITTVTNGQTAINGLVQGEYIFMLTVTDDAGAIDTDTMTVIVEQEQVEYNSDIHVALGREEPHIYKQQTNNTYLEDNTFSPDVLLYTDSETNTSGLVSFSPDGNLFAYVRDGSNTLLDSYTLVVKETQTWATVYSDVYTATEAGTYTVFNPFGMKWSQNSEYLVVYGESLASTGHMTQPIKIYSIGGPTYLVPKTELLDPLYISVGGISNDGDNGGTIFGCAFSNGGKYFVACHYPHNSAYPKKHISIYDIENDWELITNGPTSAFTYDDVYDVCFSPDDSLMAVSNGSINYVAVYDVLNSWAKLTVPKIKGPSYATPETTQANTYGTQIKFSNDGTYMVVKLHVYGSAVNPNLFIFDLSNNWAKILVGSTLTFGVIGFDLFMDQTTQKIAITQALSTYATTTKIYDFPSMTNLHTITHTSPPYHTYNKRSSSSPTLSAISLYKPI